MERVTFGLGLLVGALVVSPTLAWAMWSLCARYSEHIAIDFHPDVSSSWTMVMIAMLYWIGNFYPNSELVLLTGLEIGVLR